MEATSGSRFRGGFRLVLQSGASGYCGIVCTCTGQDWTLYRCFDSKVEVSESEDEVTYNQRLEAEIDGQGTSQALLLECIILTGVMDSKLDHES